MSDAPAFVTTDVPVPADPAADAGLKVFAGNLTYSTDEAALKEFFAAYADDITSTQIIMHGPRSAGYGFVTFTTEDTVAKAIEALDKKELDGRPVIVEKAKPLSGEKKPRRKTSTRRAKKEKPAEGDAPAEGDEAAAVAAEGGEGAPAKPKKKRTNKKKKTKKADTTGEADGTAAPTAEAAEHAVDGAAATNGGGEKKPKTRKPRPPKRPRGEAPVGEPSKSILFVANLAFSVDEEALTEFFTSNGVTVKSARVVRWRWGTPKKSKGYAFVDVGDEAEQEKAIAAVQGKTLADREITVKVAVNAPHKEEGEGDAAAEEVAPAPAGELPVVPVV